MNRRVRMSCALALAVIAAPGLSWSQDLVWAHRLGGDSPDGGRSIAVDYDGNVHTTGFFRGRVDFDPGPGTRFFNTGAVSMFVSKLSSAGNYVWARRIGGPEDSHAQGVALVLDPEGNVYVTGFFLGTVDFNPGGPIYYLTAAPGAGDVFVVKLDVDGNFVWARQFAGTSLAEGEAITLDAAGNIYVTGVFQGTVDFDPGPGAFHFSAVGDFDTFVCKLDGNGALLWARQLGGMADDFALGIAVDGAGNVYTAGWFSQTCDFDPGPQELNLTSAGGRDVFVWKLDAGGDLEWARQMGESGSAAAYDIGVDAASSVYLAGYLTASVDFDPGPDTYRLASAGNDDIFVAKLDAQGHLAWAQRIGDAARDDARSLLVDDAGAVYVTGFFAGSVDFDPGPGTRILSSEGGSGIFTLKLDTGGNHLWAVGQMSGASGNGESTSIAVGGAANVFVTGSFDGSVDFDSGAGSLELTSAGSIDIFVFKLAETPRLTFTNSDTLAWGPLLGVADYNIYRSDNTLPGTFLCFASHRGTPFVDPDTPSSGGLFAYLVTGIAVGTRLEGSLGYQAMNGVQTIERPNTHRCP